MSTPLNSSNAPVGPRLTHVVAATEAWRGLATGLPVDALCADLVAA